MYLNSVLLGIITSIILILGYMSYSLIRFQGKIIEEQRQALDERDELLMRMSRDIFSHIKEFHPDHYTEKVEKAHNQAEKIVEAYNKENK